MSLNAASTAMATLKDETTEILVKTPVKITLFNKTVAYS